MQLRMPVSTRSAMPIKTRTTATLVHIVCQGKFIKIAFCAGMSSVSIHIRGMTREKGGGII